MGGERISAALSTDRTYSPTIRLAYHPTGNQIASAHEDGAVRLWDAHTGVISHTLSGHPGIVSDLDFSPDGLRLASGNEDGTAVVWDAISGRSVQTFKVTSPVNGVAFNRDGTLFATASQGSMARVRYQYKKRSLFPHAWRRIVGRRLSTHRRPAGRFRAGSSGDALAAEDPQGPLRN